MSICRWWRRRYRRSPRALCSLSSATSGALEQLVTARTADSVRGLSGPAPGTVTFRVGAGGGEETVNAADPWDWGHRAGTAR